MGNDGSVSPVTRAEQAAWQRGAHHVLGQLLERAATEDLPPILWTVHSAGAALTGECSAPDLSQRREDFSAWLAALGGTAEPEHASHGMTRLVARTEPLDGLVTVDLVASTFDDEPAPPAT